MESNSPVTRKQINEVLLRVYREEYEHLSGDGKHVSDIEAAGVNAVLNEFESIDMLHSLLEAQAHSTRKSYTKANNVGAALSGAKQGDLFNDALRSAIVEVEGFAMKFEDLKFDGVLFHKNNVVDNNVRQQAQYVKQMSVITELEKSRLRDDPTLRVGDIWDELIS